MVTVKSNPEMLEVLRSMRDKALGSHEYREEGFGGRHEAFQEFQLNLGRSAVHVTCLPGARTCVGVVEDLACLACEAVPLPTPFDHGGPSMGTTGAGRQHAYKVRMGSFPCAWSLAGADAMARVRSHLTSGRALPRRTRVAALPPREGRPARSAR